MSATLRTVLIHGAGLNSAIWKDVANRLDSPNSAIDLPMRGQANLDVDKLSLDDYVSAVLTEIDAFAEPNVVLVGHSIGAVVAAQVAVRTLKRVVGYVVIGGLLPHKGQSFSACLPFPQKVLLPVLLRIFGTKPPETAIRGGLCSGLSDQQAEPIIRNFTPESRRLFTDRVANDLPNTKCLYVRLTADKEIPLNVQDRMAQRLDQGTVQTLACGHLPMIEEPDSLADTLNSFVASVG